VKTPLVTETARVDGRRLPAPTEPGSDALLVLGLIALLRRLNPMLGSAPEDQWDC
jgi:hypothetical protein